MAGMPPKRIARWLLCPLLFVLGLWTLLLQPGLFAAFPSLWSTGGKGLQEVLPPHPKSRVQTFELGWHAARYEEHCSGRAPSSSERCAETLRLAGEAVQWPEPLSEAQLLGVKALLADLDAQRSVVDRTLGLLSFVNIIWLVSIVGILATVGPFVAYIFGPFLISIVGRLFNQVILPTIKALHRWGVLEAAAYTVAFAFSVQGSRYSEGQAGAALNVALTGGLAFVPCWVYSTTLHVESSGGHTDEFCVITGTLLMLTLTPLASMHSSRLIGFLAVLSLYGALGFFVAAFPFGYMVGFSGEDALQRCLLASVMLIIGFAGLRMAGIDAPKLQPFAAGAMCLGNVMYFLALLIQSSRWRHSRTYWQWQTGMACSLLAALFVGNVYALPSMANTATTFMLLYFFQKQIEVKWDSGFAIVVFFCNFVGLYYLAHYLHTHPEHIASMFDARGLYLPAPHLVV